MPCAQFEALKRCRQAWHDRGIDSNESTIKDDNNDDAKMQVTLKGNGLSLKQESARPPWTCSRESFSSAREQQKPSTTTK
jgi:hypothetical protein